jgi:hypothetical protein
MSDSALRLAIDLARTLFPYEARGRRAVRGKLPDGRQGIAAVAAGPADRVLLLAEPTDGY